MTVATTETTGFTAETQRVQRTATAGQAIDRMVF
jgi:hypothetical protein